MTSRNIRGIIYLCFFFSGICGLVYEVVWARYFCLIFGATTYAYTLVLSTFMGGLAIGSFILGKVADRTQDRLYLYAWLEMGIAAICVVTPKILVYTKDIYIAAARSLSLSPAGIVMIKFIIGAIIMLPPTILMGGTLPVLSKALVGPADERGNVVARLYYVNTFGAVAGTILAGFYLIRISGLAFSVISAALVNFACGFTALLLSKRYEPELIFGFQKRSTIAGKEEKAEGSTEEAPYPAGILAISLAAIFLSGFVAMLYEITWTRLLSMVLGSSTYAFSLMLAAFISGIAIGSFIISKKMPKTQKVFCVFGLCETGIGLALLILLPFYEKLPLIFLNISWILSRRPEAFIFYEILQFLFSFFLMLPPTILLGMSLPLVCKLASRKYELLGKSIGTVLSSNTSGNIAGSMATGLILIPLVGLKRTFELGIIINLFLGIIISAKDQTLSKKAKSFIAGFSCAAFIVYMIAMPDWNKVNFSAQIFRSSSTPESFREAIKKRNMKNMLFYKDGLNDTIMVMKNDDESLSLMTNGKTDASTKGDLVTQMLCAHIPLILKPQAKDVFILGLGSGITCGSALCHPIDNLDVLEISPSVVDAAGWFSPYNHDALSDKRLNLHIEDAKTFLQRTDKKYDIIINEPSNPWVRGIAGVFSIEYFRSCYDRLKDDGVAVQWVQAYETDDDIFTTIVRTFKEVFPEVTMWSCGVRDVILLGSKTKMEVNLAESEKRISQKAVLEDLERAKIRDMFTLLAVQTASSETVKKEVEKEGRIQSDYFPIIEYMAPASLYTNSNALAFLSDIDERRLSLDGGGLYLKDYLGGRNIKETEFHNLFDFITEYRIDHNFLIMPSLVKKWKAEYPQSEGAVFAYASNNSDSLENGLNSLERLIAIDAKEGNLRLYAQMQLEWFIRLRSIFLPEVSRQAKERLTSCSKLYQDRKAMFLFFLGRICFIEKDYQNALGYFKEAESLIAPGDKAKSQDINYAEFINYMTGIYFKQGDLINAAFYAKKALQIDKDNPLACAMLKMVYLKAVRQKKIGP